MTFLLDTNICIFALKGQARVVEELQRHHPTEIAICTISVAELRFGARKSRQPDRMRALQDAFLGPFSILDFTQDAADHYAEIRYYLEARGTPVGERDQLIASVARANKLTVVTGNLREFQRVPDLSVTEW